MFVVDPLAVGIPPNHQRDARSPLAQCKHHWLFTPIFAESNPGMLLNNKLNKQNNIKNILNKICLCDGVGK